MIKVIDIHKPLVFGLQSLEQTVVFKREIGVVIDEDEIVVGLVEDVVVVEFIGLYGQILELTVAFTLHFQVVVDEDFEQTVEVLLFLV